MDAPKMSQVPNLYLEVTHLTSYSFLEMAH